jgi:stage II sporulation protein GA (sporulation sigma-E factor processing peptidase)
MTVYVDILFALNMLLDDLLLQAGARLGGGEDPARALSGRVRGGGALRGGLGCPRAGISADVRHEGGRVRRYDAAGLRPGAQHARLAALFLAAALGFGGLTFLCTQLFGTGLLILNGSAYYPVSLPALVLLAGSVYLLSRLAFCGLWEHGGGEIRTITLRLNGRAERVRALRDTGNTLKDPMTGERAIVAEWRVAGRLLPEAALCAADFEQPAALMTRLSRQYPQLRFRLLPYRSVGGRAGSCWRSAAPKAAARSRPPPRSWRFPESGLGRGQF